VLDIIGVSGSQSGHEACSGRGWTRVTPLGVLEGAPMTFRTLALVLLAMAGPAFAQEEGFRDGRLRYVEPGVTLQRGSETGAEEAMPNLPFLPGDRLWTGRGG